LLQKRFEFAYRGKLHSRFLEWRELPEVWPVGTVDLCVDWEVRVSGGKDAVVGVRQNWGQGDEAGALWPVEHLRLKLGELVLEVWESLWQSFDNAGVNRVKHPLLGGTEVLGSWLEGKINDFFADKYYDFRVGRGDF